MEFKTGHFMKLRVTNKIHLGQIPMDLPGDVIIEFDGSTLRWGGKDYNVPGLVGGYRLGWLVEESDNVSQYIPQPAGVQVHSATSSGSNRQEAMNVERASEDEQEVGTLAGSNARRKAANSVPMSAEGKAPKPATRPVSRPSPVVPTPSKTAPVTKTASKPQQSTVKKAMVTEAEPAPIEIDFKVGNKKKAPISMQVFDDQNEGAVAVAKLRPASSKTVLVSAETSSSVDVEINKLTSVQGNSPPRIEKFAVVQEDQEGVSISKKFANGASGDVDKTLSGDELEEILPDAAVSGMPKTGMVTGDSGFQWDKSGKWQDRVKKAVKSYGKDQDALRQIMELETAQVIKGIKQEISRLKK